MFLPRCRNVATVVDCLAEKKVSKISMSYEAIVGTITLGMPLRVSRKHEGRFDGQGYSQYSVSCPEDGTPQQWFAALVSHGLELQGLLGAAELCLRPYLDDLPEVPPHPWVGV